MTITVTVTPTDAIRIGKPHKVVVGEPKLWMRMYRYTCMHYVVNIQTHQHTHRKENGGNELRQYTKNHSLQNLTGTNTQRTIGLKISKMQTHKKP